MPLNNRRRWVTVLSLIPALSLFALMAWALARDIGNPEGLGINSHLGENPTTNSEIPDFSVVSIDGEHITPKNLEGKVVMFDFWSSWCPPCRWEMPAFEQVWREYKNQDVMFVGIAVSDAEEDARAFVDTAGVSYPIGLDTTGEFTRNYRVKTLPTTILIDRAGTETRKMSNVANETVLKLFLKRLIENGT